VDRFRDLRRDLAGQRDREEGGGMKLLVVVSEFPKLTETFVYRNVAEYRRLGHEVSLFHVKPFRGSEIVHGFARDIVPDAFGFATLGGRALGGLAREAARRPGSVARLAAIIVRAHAREPKRGAIALSLVPKGIALGHWCRAAGIAHIHAEFAGFPATVAMIAARTAGIPFSFSAHANDIFVSQALLAEKAEAATFVRAISRYNVDFLSALDGFPRDRLRVIRCGVDPALLDAPAPAGPGDGPLHVLYVGSLIAKKGVEFLVDAIARVRNEIPVVCRIVGGGDRATALAERVERLGLGDVVRFDGALPAEAVSAAYAWSHVVVVPSVHGARGRMEGIPVVSMEALAHGRPVIATALSGIPELVETGATGFLVPPGDAAAIAEALRAVWRDWDGAAALGARGRARIGAEYRVDRNAATLAEAMAG
jgi:colanic acid/amylovoran biosynthesis glycosyltransferase